MYITTAFARKTLQRLFFLGFISKNWELKMRFSSIQNRNFLQKPCISRAFVLKYFSGVILNKGR